MENPYKKKTDDDLVFHAGQFPGDRGNEAELTRRLIESINKFNDSTERYSTITVAFTFILFVIAMMQLATGIWALNFSMAIRATVFVIAFLVLLYAVKLVDKELFSHKDKQ